MLREIMQSIEKQMLAQLAEIRAKFRHSGDKGISAEDVFRSFLREYLPRRLAVGHGEVIDQSDNRSGQADVVIVNDDHPFTFTADKPGIFFVEGVSAAGEVKTVLNSSHLKTAIVASQKFKVLRVTHAQGNQIHTNESDRERFYNCPPYFVFAFESELEIPTIIRELNAAAPNIAAKPYPLIDAVFILNKGWATNFGDGLGALTFIDSTGEKHLGWVWKEAENVLFDCLGWIAGVMPVVRRFEPIIIGYMHKSRR